ncbi:MAG: hypothetical protein ACC682_11435 [Gemmatimonadota bacterium]
MRTRTIIWMLVVVALAAVAPRSADAQARPLGSLADMRNASSSMERDAENAAQQAEVDKSGRDAVNGGIDLLNQGMDLYEAARGFTEADAALSDVLNPDDLEFNPDYSPDGAPDVPVQCEVLGGADCEQCYTSGYQKLNFVRFYLEKLRGIYGATRNYTDNAIEFGDAMAQLPGGFGLAWPPERKGIQESLENLGRTYDRKYQDYMKELKAGLDKVAECESQFFGEEDWYNRFGFIYYTYMQDRYRR